MKEYKIDLELNDVLPDLSDKDYEALEQSLLIDKFKGAPIMVWGDIIVDGHNRYEICKKHNIPFEVKTVEFESKEDAIRWMVRQQIGRRTLSPLQRINIVEKYRPFYKKKAEKNKSLNGGDKKSKLQNSSTPIPKAQKIDVRAELAGDANVSTDTYSKGLKILESGSEELISQTMNNVKTINKAYQELKSKSENDDSRTLIKSELKSLNDAKIKEDSQNSKEMIANQQMLLQIQERYNGYLAPFQNDVAWLLEREFIENDKDVTGKIHSDMRNCLEKFKSIHELLENMKVDEIDNNTLEVVN